MPGSGIRDKRMGNACLWTLIHMPDGAGVPYLARLLNQVKYPSVKKVINAALDEAAEAAGLSRGTLDELSVPTHDLEDGKLEIAIGPDGGAALLEIVGTADVSLAFRRADGKTTASVPAELKEFKAEIAAGTRRGEGDRSGPDDAGCPPAAHLARAARLEFFGLGGALSAATRCSRR